MRAGGPAIGVAGPTTGPTEAVAPGDPPKDPEDPEDPEPAAGPTDAGARAGPAEAADACGAAGDGAETEAGFGVSDGWFALASRFGS